FFSSRRRHTRSKRDWSSDVCSSDLNLIVSQSLNENGFQPLSFFQITPIGIIALIIGILYLYFTRNHLLPDIKSKGTNTQQQLTPSQLSNDYLLGESLYSVKVSVGSEMIGKALADLKLPANYQVYIFKIAR